jgi:hypothetical protein
MKKGGSNDKNKSASFKKQKTMMKRSTTKEMQIFEKDSFNEDSLEGTHRLDEDK